MNTYNFVLMVASGWVTGAFVNYTADILPYRRRFVMPYCLNCEIQQGLWNYFIWPRRCNNCNQARSRRIWIVELMYVIIAVWLWSYQSQGLQFIAGMIVLAYFGIVTIIDFEHRLIMHPVSLVGVGLGLIYGTMSHGIVDTLLGGLAGFGIMLVLYLLGHLFARFINKRRGEELEDEALGYGDVNLGGVLGLFLGWPGIIVGLIIAILLAGIVSLAYLLFSVITRRYRHNMTIAYGPYLVISATLLLFFKDLLI